MLSALRAAAVPVAGLALLASLPWLAPGFYVDLVGKVMILAMLALSLELIVGTTGLVSLGHAAFFGIGAYASALLNVRAGVEALPLLALSAIACAAAYAAVVGALALRTRGVYFIMVTLAFAQMAYFVFHDTALGGGTDGLYLNARPAIAIGDRVLVDLGRGPGLYLAVLACLAAVYALLAAVLRARFGRALAGIRVSEQRMRALGYATYPYKLAAFVLAGALAGFAGFLVAIKDGFVNPEMLSWQQSGTLLVMIILGGLGSLRGAVIGAFALAVLEEVFQSAAIFGDFAKHWQLLLGLAIIVLVAAMPEGLAGAGRRVLGARRRATVRMPVAGAAAGDGAGDGG